MDTSITIPAYNSSTGAGTLTGIAKDNGVSVNDIVNANRSNTAALPNPGNPNLIVAGQSLNIPKASVIQTTTDQRDQTASRVANLNGMMSNMGANNSINQNTGGAIDANGNIVDGKGNILGKADPKDIIPGAKTPGSGDGKTDTSSATEDPFSDIQSQISGLKSDAKDQITTINNNLNTLKGNVDANTSSMITALQGIYASRISSTESSFDRLEASKAESGYRNGLTRYTSDQEGGVLTTIEVNKQAAVAKLQADLQVAISKAQQAQTDNDTKAFNDAYDHIDNINKEMKSQVGDLYKTAVEKQNADLKASQQAQTETAATLKNTLAVSGKIAPGVAAQLKDFKTDEEKANFISETATAEGIDPAVLLGDVTGALSKSEKDALDIENIKSEIAKRGTTGSGKSGGVSTTFKTAPAIASVTTQMDAIKGGDNYIDPDKWVAARNTWNKLGGTDATFNSNFKKYLNPESYAVAGFKAPTTSTGLK